MKRLTLILLILSWAIAQAKINFTAYPYLAYSSETKLMVGAFSVFQYDLINPELEAETLEFDLLANTIYSLNKQFLFVITNVSHLCNPLSDNKIANNRT
ncbi:MAG: hypothetical protein PHY24_08635 [Candidatus Cloacimonetes bacterium]|jgi:hypothetical protein|nr:hypothetical protein [Candidatus Cloacimonadota bacterium]